MKINLLLIFILNCYIKEMVDQAPFIVSMKSENKYKYQTSFSVVNYKYHNYL